jgi:hypothetical protein
MSPSLVNAQDRRQIHPVPGNCAGCRLIGVPGLTRPFSQLAGFVLAEPEDGSKSFVDAPLLVWADPTHHLAKPSGIDCADLLNEDASGRT